MQQVVLNIYNLKYFKITFLLKMANGLIQKKVNNKTLEEKVKETQDVSFHCLI